MKEFLTIIFLVFTVTICQAGADIELPKVFLSQMGVFPPETKYEVLREIALYMLDSRKSKQQPVSDELEATVTSFLADGGVYFADIPTITKHLGEDQPLNIYANVSLGFRIRIIQHQLPDHIGLSLTAFLPNTSAAPITDHAASVFFDALDLISHLNLKDKRVLMVHAIAIEHTIVLGQAVEVTTKGRASRKIAIELRKWAEKVIDHQIQIQQSLLKLASDGQIDQATTAQSSDNSCQEQFL